MDRSPYWRTSDRRAIIATLVFAGPRAHELCHMLWRDVDLANGRIYIGRSKTQAGLREIPLLPILRDELAAHKASAYRAGPDDLVFPTGTGGIRDKDNLRNRILAAAVDRADKLLQKHGQTPLPAQLVLLPDGSQPRFGALRYRGPGTVLCLRPTTTAKARPWPTRTARRTVGNRAGRRGAVTRLVVPAGRSVEFRSWDGRA